MNSVIQAGVSGHNRRGARAEAGAAGRIRTRRCFACGPASESRSNESSSPTAAKIAVQDRSRRASSAPRPCSATSDRRSRRHSPRGSPIARGRASARRAPASQSYLQRRHGRGGGRARERLRRAPPRLRLPLGEPRAGAPLAREHGLVFVGPPAEVIELAGDKLARPRSRQSAPGCRPLPGEELASPGAARAAASESATRC